MYLQAAMLLAILLQGALAMLLLVWLGMQRLPLVSAGRIRVADIALSQEPWPDRVKQASRAFSSQFELPVLFFVAAFLCLMLGPTWPDVILALAFVMLRYAHAVIFITSNHVPSRFYTYVAGFAVLGAWWLLLTVRVAPALLAGP